MFDDAGFKYGARGDLDPVMLGLNLATGSLELDTNMHLVSILEQSTNIQIDIK